MITEKYYPINENRKNELDEIIENLDFANPVGENFLRALTLEELKYFRQTLHWRVRHQIGDDLGLAGSDEGKRALPENHDLRLMFVIKNHGGNRLIEFNGKEVYYEHSCQILLGEWIEKFQKMVREIRLELEIQKDLELQNERDKLIRELLGEK